MKKIFSACFSAFILLNSCDKNAIQQTTQTIKNADSLYHTVSRGYKTVDSISKVLKNDSAALPPEIREKTEIIRKNINLKNLSVKNLDSVSAALKAISGKVEGGADLAKTIDSAANAVKNSDDPLAAISAVTGAVSKISKRNSVKIRKVQQDSEEDSGDQIPDDPAFYEQGRQKSADITILVDHLKPSRQRLKDILQNFNAEIVTENFTGSEGTSRENFTVKIPSKYFDEGLNQIETLGETSEKSVSTESSDDELNEMCDIKIVLKENADFTGKDTGSPFTTRDEPSAGREETPSGFMKGWYGLAAVLGALLPFWPLLLLVGIVWYFASRQKRRKKEKELARQQQYNEAMRQKIAEQIAQQAKREPAVPPSETPPAPDDYSRFMPK